MNETITSFADFQLNSSILEGLDSMGFSEPTPVQIKAIPVILENKDIIASAQTGTGKTAAYVLPILHKISEENGNGGLNTLIISPTRELAQQIDQQIIGFGYFAGVSSIPVYGGGSGSEFEKEKQAFKTGADIVVATPGKLIQHLNMGYVNTKNLKHLVLDEADRMLDMGFYEDIMKIISHLPKERQTLLFSATMPPKIRQLAKTILKDPVEISIAISKTAEGVRQRAFSVTDEQKEPLLEHIILKEKPENVIVFTSRKSSVRTIERGLRGRGIKARGISSDLEQNERENVLREFKNGEYTVLVATDIMSRGIDIADLAMVVNYDVPHDGEDYVHRVGRTARAKSTGEAITFVIPKDQRNFYRIEKLTGLEIEKPAIPDEIGTSPSWQSPSQGGSSNRGRSFSNSGDRRNKNPGAGNGQSQGAKPYKKRRFKPRGNSRPNEGQRPNKEE